jgi:hypothetical protein
MGAELFADLRGIIGVAGNFVGNPLALYVILLTIYLIYRMTSR